MTFAFAAAGTGGHVYPALAVARALIDEGVEPDDVIFFGGERLEATAVPGAGFELVPIEIRGLSRSLSARNFTLPAVVARATNVVRDTLVRRGTDVLTSFGGYVGVPGGVGARRARVPLVVHEQNAVAGLANKVVSRWADRVFVAFDRANLPRAELVGNPLRREFELFDRAALRSDARSRYGLSGERPVLGVLGGSLGARSLNEAAIAFAGRSAGSHDIVHLTGPAHFVAVAAEVDAIPGWHGVSFEESMELFYAAVDVVLSRSGALTISELAATGTPAVVVPYAAGTAGHQAANAAQLAEAGGCVIVDEAELDTLPALLADILDDPDRMRRMSVASASVGHPDAADVIATALLEFSHA
jgi:UDP-N-acetylglucosamine--N-acetylmuramyl-(pentapeptide) pyrophosphoryl-undecaprenol N-acetylglucosamine transferase